MPNAVSQTSSSRGFIWQFYPKYANEEQGITTFNLIHKNESSALGRLCVEQELPAE